MNDSDIFKKYNLDLSINYLDTKALLNSDKYFELTYYEVDLLFENLDTKNKIFYDLRSGSGNTLFRSAINYQFKKCIGIELSFNLYLHSKKLLSTINCENLKNKIDFRYGDIIIENIDDADIIYISNVFFTNDINKKIGEKIKNNLKSNCIVFCFKEIYLNVPFQKINITSKYGKKIYILKYNL